MSKTPEWTDDEFREFNRLTWATSSRSQLERIEARLKLREFIGVHGGEKCDAMFAEIQRRERTARK